MVQGMLAETVEEVVAEKMEDPEWAQVLCKYLMQMNRGEYPQGYLDALAQKHWGKRYDIFDAYSFCNIHTAINTGKIAIFSIPIGELPVADCQIDEMNDILSRLEFPFSAEFWGGTQGSDGLVKLNASVNGIVTDRKKGVRAYAIIPNGTLFPLEVGTTSFAKTFMYLHLAWYNGGGPINLARWPYGQRNITLFSIFPEYSGEKFDNLLPSVWGGFDQVYNPWTYWKKANGD